MHCLRPGTIEANRARLHAGVLGRCAVRREVQSRANRAACRPRRGRAAFRLRVVAEVALVRQMFPDAEIHFMHPVKARGTIREAWSRHGVRNFVLDTPEELAKIVQEVGATGIAGELGLIVRLALPKARPCWICPASSAPRRRLRLPAACRRGPPARLGISFHVGSQCLDPLAWRIALDLAGQAVPRRRRRAGDDRCGGRLSGVLSGLRTTPARRLPGRDRCRVRAHWAAGMRGSGRNLAAPWWLAARPLSCRSSSAATRHFMSTTAYMAAWPMPGARVPLSGAADPA